ncbi:SigB/SigF/SigG family RNA polymerase sigma factor [Amycolatopsis antarctica]|uniref:SigB/SigF/SigG family RNA polymerase sigma factor n=1 Tax=Amycolatopsis antarctica TaxID=1854586 RepID=UPI003B831D96
MTTAGGPGEPASRDDADRDVRQEFRRLRALEPGEPRHAELRERLVHRHADLARNLARRFRYQSESMDDLVQIATLGLINAVDRFDPEHGAEFVGFAVPTITGELRRHYRDAGWSVRVPRRLKEMHARLGAAREDLTAKLERAPRPSELAEHLGVGKEEVYECLVAERGQHGTSLDAMLEDSAHTGFGRPDDNLEQAELRAMLMPLVRDLPERDRRIMLLRFGYGMSQSDIARRVGVSQMQVSRLLTSLLRQLRTQIGDEGGAPG